MIWVNIIGFAVIVGIIWWFWIYKPSDVSTDEGELIVTVENGVYQPARLKIPAGKATSIKFIRKAESPCAGTIVFSDLNISEELPLNQEKIIEIPALDAGTYSFTCQMQMYRGELIVGKN